MKICIFAKGLPIHCTGGVEIHIQELVDGLIKRGHHVTIITTKHPKGVEKEERENLKIYYIGDRSLVCTQKFYKESARLFEYLHKKEHFDIVHSQSGAGRGYIMYARKTIPIVISYHGTAIDEIRSKINVLASNVSLSAKVKSVLSLPKYVKGHVLTFSHPKQFDGAVATSNEQIKILKDVYKYPDDKIYTVFNGIDTETFQPSAHTTLREKYGLEKNKIILTVSKLQDQKGIQNIILALPRILREIKNAKLFIVGDGNYRADLERIVQKNNLEDKVIFTGTIPIQNLPEYFNTCDVFVNPTIRQNGYDLTILEAMACEKPVVVSSIGSVPTAIADGIDGILVPPGNIEKIANAVLHILQDTTGSLRLGKSAREKIIQKFNIECMIDGTIQVYQEVIQKYKEARSKIDSI